MEAWRVRCSGFDRDCRPYVYLEVGANDPMAIYCVGPESRIPPTEPSDAEITSCLRRVTSIVRATSSVPSDAVDEAALNVVFAARRACNGRRDADYQAFVKRLRSETGAGNAESAPSLADALIGVRARAARRAKWLPTCRRDWTRSPVRKRRRGIRANAAASRSSRSACVGKPKPK